ncbi:MAG: ferredoxin [Clostridiaceae bacterium]|jgi:NAD-dependent dihydropyrimidine dehydrogenase PreA subunit|nr:ferredoxin [Clostridiaceae bacterium]
MRNAYLKNVVTLKLYEEKCTGCGMCINVCPQGVFEIVQGKSHIIAKDSCMECGACAKNCAFSAIEVKSGTGCAYAIIAGKLKGSEPNCGCSCEDQNCC